MYIKGNLNLVDCYFRETHSHCILFCLPFIYDSTRTLCLATTFSTMISELKQYNDIRIEAPKTLEIG